MTAIRSDAGERRRTMSSERIRKPSARRIDLATTAVDMTIQGGKTMSRTRIPLSAAEESARRQAERLEMSTAEIGLSVRTTNCLEEKGIFTVHDLLRTTRGELLSISNFGEKTLEEVYLALEKIGFHRPERRPAK